MIQAKTTGINESCDKVRIQRRKKVFDLFSVVKMNENQKDLRSVVLFIKKKKLPNIITFQCTCIDN